MTRFFILAGGEGTRAQPLSKIKPKVLFPIDGLPLLDHLLKNIHQAGCSSGYINVFHLSDQIRDAVEDKSGLTVISEEALTGNLILKQCLDQVKNTEHLLVVNGDVLTPFIPLKQMDTLLRRQNCDGVILTKEAAGVAGYNSIKEKDGFFTGREKCDPGKKSLLYTGIALLTRNTIEIMEDINMFDSFERQRSKILLYPLDGFWLDIGDPGSYYNSNFKYKKIQEDRGKNSISPGCSISPGSEISGSLIWEGVRIKDSVIENCIVTSHLHLDSVRLKSQIIYKKDGAIQSYPFKTGGN